MIYSLVMIFKTTSSEKVTLSIDGVKSDINDIEVNNLMDEIISRKVFKTKKGFLKTKVSASLVKRTEKTFIIA
ncbi:MAG: DUF2922 domain-containing protein [Clostridiales bacterium]|nr:DUF2922 domain-containing protein [Clostridiales bacterium]MDY2728819.1 DUF2922 domain-containing protein [Clostridium sp.]